MTFAWIAASPEHRYERWLESGRAHARVLHNEALQYGARALSEAEFAQTDGAQKLPAVVQLAADADDYWSARVDGFRGPGPDPAHNLLTLKGLYTGLYRIASPATHGQVRGIESYLGDADQGRVTVQRAAWQPEMSLVPVSVPVFSMGLIVCADRFGWPDAEAAREFNEALSYTPTQER